MDYKILILFIILIGVCILLYREISNTRHDITNKLKSLNDNIIEYSNKTKIFIKNDIDDAINKIKLANIENIQQIRKMNTIQNELITKNSNHFTSDTESDDDDFTPNMNYSSNQNGSSLFNVEKIVKSKDISHKKMTNIENDNIILLDNRRNTFLPSLPNNINVIPITEFVQYLDSNQCQFQKQIADINKANNTDTNTDYISDISFSEIDSGKEPIENTPTHVMDNYAVVEAVADVCIELVNKTDIIPEQSSVKHLYGDEESHKSDTDIKNDDITVGSKHKNKKKTEIKIKQQSDNLVDAKSDDVSGVEELKNIDSYNIDVLKKIAKKFGVSLMYKVEGKWKQYKKEELYNKIKESLQ